MHWFQILIALIIIVLNVSSITYHNHTIGSKHFKTPKPIFSAIRNNGHQSKTNIVIRFTTGCNAKTYITKKKTIVKNRNSKKNSLNYKLTFYNDLTKFFRPIFRYWSMINWIRFQTIQFI